MKIQKKCFTTEYLVEEGTIIKAELRLRKDANRSGSS